MKPQASDYSFKFCRELLRFSLDSQDLGAAGGAGNQLNSRFGSLQALGEKCLKRAVGLVVLRNSADPDLQAGLPGSVADKAVDSVRRRRWREPDGDINPAV